MPTHITLHACGWPAGTRLTDVIRHYRRMGWHVRLRGLQLVATRLH